MAGLDYSLDGDVAVIQMDDGRVNALSPEMIGAIDAALDQSETDGAPVVLLGRPGTFSAGFDLKVMKRADASSLGMIRAGFLLSTRLLLHPRPVIIACTGHAVAMGSFLLLSGDVRIGADGPYKIVANEVAIGMTLPRPAIELCRERLSPAEFQRATILSHSYTPQTAVRAGFLDQVVPEAELDTAAMELARASLELDPKAHVETKRRVRGAAVRRIRALIRRDMVELAMQGVQIATSKLVGRSA